MSMMRSSFVCLSVKKIPFVLCGSRFAPLMTRMKGMAVVEDSAVWDLKTASPSVVSDVDNVYFSLINATRQKIGRKKSVFDALVRWCVLHQQAAIYKEPLGDELFCSTTPVHLPQLLKADEAVLGWLREFSTLLTCGQTLLVCSFVCEVLICSLEVAPQRVGTEETRLLQDRVRALTNRIATLLQRANESDKLESQPLSILVSCIYGLHRLASLETPFLDETEKTLLRIPTALMFAMVHQLRGEALEKLFQLEAQVAVAVCLSFLLIANEERRQVLFSNGETVLVNTVLRHLLRHISPLLKQLESSSNVDLEGHAGELLLTRHSQPLLPNVREGVVDFPSMRECATIMQNIAFSSTTNRVGMLSYLLRVRRNPAHYTQEEVRLLPTVLNTVATVRLSEYYDVVSKIVEEIPFPENDLVLVASFYGYAGTKKAYYLSCLNSVKQMESFSPQDAAQIIHFTGVHLHWEVLKRFVSLALGDDELFVPLASPSIIRPKFFLTDAVVDILMVLLSRLDDLTRCFEKENTLACVTHLFKSIDWSKSEPPESAKMALQRLVLLSRLSSYGFVVNTPEITLALVEKVLVLEFGSNIATTLRCVIDVLPLFSDAEQCKGVVERMLTYNGTRSTSSVIRFLAFLSPLAVKYGVYSSELLQQLLKLHTLNPLRLRQGSIDGILKDTNVFTSFLTNAIDFLLYSPEWRVSANEMREAITLWVHDYLHYVISSSRKRKAWSEKVQAEAERGTVSLLNKEETLSTEAEMEEGPNNEELERVFSCLLRANVKVPEFFASELASRARGIERDGSHAESTESRIRPLFPAHFVFCCKLDISVDSPLSYDFLEYLIATCDCRLIHFIVTAFLTKSRVASQETCVSLQANLQLVSQSLKFFLRRVEHMKDDVAKGFQPLSLSFVATQIMRFFVSFLTKQVRTQRVLESFSRSQSIRNQEKKPGDENNKKGKNTEVDNLNDELVLELNNVEELFLRLVTHISAAHLKEMGLLLLDRLDLLTPGCAKYIMLNLQNKLVDFTHVELFYLVRKYPKAQEFVIMELKKRDIPLSVDLNDYVRVARTVPMTIHLLVIEAFLPTLNFQWCTRLLSALSVSREPIPVRLLELLLRRLESEAENATVMDRNVTLVVLQKYLNYEHPVTNDGLPCDCKCLVERCCDRLLVLEEIHSLESLSTFLSTFPGTLRDVVGAAITERVVHTVVPGLLANLSALLDLCRLLQKHMLLWTNVKTAVAEAFFFRSSPADGDDNALLFPASCSSFLCMPLATHPLGDILSLALLLMSDCSSQTKTFYPEGVAAPAEDQNHNCNNQHSGDVVGIRVMKVVREQFSSVASKLVIMSALLEQKESAASGHTCGAEAETICAELIKESEKMSSSEFSRLLQCISRLKCWHLVKNDEMRFGDVFQRACRQADAHSRCVLFKALSSDVELFHYYEPFMLHLLGEAVDVMSQEDLEMVLSAVFGLPLTESLESLIDAVSTRIFLMAEQCKRSVLIRMLQCQASLRLQDDALVTRLFTILEEQCSRETRLDTTQALTLLQAAVDLDVPIQPKLAVTCFSWLEHHIDCMTTAQLGHALRLAAAVEMGYTASVHAVAMRALEQREAIRSNATFRESVEIFCDEFSVEIPWHMRVTVQRRRHNAERLKDLNVRGAV